MIDAIVLKLDLVLIEKFVFYKFEIKFGCIVASIIKNLFVAIDTNNCRYKYDFDILIIS